MPKGGKKGGGGRHQEEETTRIAVVSDDKCKPKKCKLECKKNCPVNRQGKVCIDVKSSSKIAFISEILCIGCNICVKKLSIYCFKMFIFIFLINLLYICTKLL